MSKNSKSYRKVPLEVSVQIRILHQECGYGIAKLQKRFPAFPKTTVYRHMKKPIENILADKKEKQPWSTTKVKKTKRTTDHEKYE